MISRTITYENFNGEEKTQTLYFHLKATALARMELRSEMKGHTFPDLMQKLLDAKEYEKIYDIIGEILEMSYGEKSEDGEQFVQTDEIRENFKHSAIFDKVLIDLLTDEEDAMVFLNGLVPKSVVEKANSIANSGFSIV